MKPMIRSMKLRAAPAQHGRAPLAASAAALLLALAGCKTPAQPTYTTSRDTLFHLQQLPEAKASVGDFNGGPRSLDAAKEGIACQLKVRGDAEGRPFDLRAYIEQSLAAELAAAGRYDAAATPRISGTIDYMELQRELPFNATWTIVLTLQSSNGASLQTRGDYRFDVGDFAGYTTCVHSVEAFAPAVRTVLETAVRSPEFGALLAAG